MCTVPEGNSDIEMSIAGKLRVHPNSSNPGTISGTSPVDPAICFELFTQTYQEQSASIRAQ